MGTSLSGLTPATTYDALIKVGDNGPLSGTAKVLSDGLGNDSVLALSTTAVGVGTASPAAPLNVNGSSGADLLLSRTSGATSGVLGTMRFGNQNVDSNMSAISAEQDGATDAANLIFSTQATGGATSPRMTITSTGNVGIGVSSPEAKLSVSNSTAALNVFRAEGVAANLYIDHAGSGSNLYDATNHKFRTFAGVEVVNIDANGIKFNGDTAAANALDDYEEGAWTIGISFGGASVGVTTSLNTGTYTKIGRQVTVNGFINLTNKGSSTGNARITGLPFTIANNNANYSAGIFRFDKITFANQFQGYGEINGTSISLEETTILGLVTPLTDADFANNSDIIVTLTYFV